MIPGKLHVVHHQWVTTEWAQKILAEQEAAFQASPIRSATVYKTTDPGGYHEYLGLLKVWQVAQMGAEYIGYWHTKGANHIGSESCQDWRRYMEHFFLQGPPEQIGWDVSGVNYRTVPWPHFSGDFFWARGDYIRGFPEPVWQADRNYWEEWVCSRPHRPLNLHDAGVDHYHQRYPPERYQ